jgi:hypothetical protein
MSLINGDGENRKHHVPAAREHDSTSGRTIKGLVPNRRRFAGAGERDHSAMDHVKAPSCAQCETCRAEGISRSYKGRTTCAERMVASSLDGAGHHLSTHPMATAGQIASDHGAITGCMEASPSPLARMVTGNLSQSHSGPHAGSARSTISTCDCVPDPRCGEPARADARRRYHRRRIPARAEEHAAMHAVPTR